MAIAEFISGPCLNGEHVECDYWNCDCTCHLVENHHVIPLTEAAKVMVAKVPDHAWDEKIEMIDRLVDMIGKHQKYLDSMMNGENDFTDASFNLYGLDRGWSEPHGA